MVSMPQASRGRTVYSGGSFAPTRGPVSGQGAQGYLKRESRKNNMGIWGGSSRFGKDGKSDTRSGVAQRAMQRRGGIGGWAGGMMNNAIGKGSGGFGANQQGGGGSNSGGGNPQQQGGNEPAAVGAPVGQAPPSVATPTVVVGDAGKLELPYDPSYGQDVYDALKSTNDEIAGVGMQEQAQAGLYAQQQHMQGQQYDSQKVRTLNKGGASGNLFSSGQGMAIASDENMNQNALNALATDNNAVMTGLGTQRSSIQNAFRQFLSNRTLNYADDLSEDAGELGYGSQEPGLNSPNGATMPQYPGRPKPKPPGHNKPKPPQHHKPKPPAGHTPPRKPGQSPPNRPPRSTKK